MGDFEHICHTARMAHGACPAVPDVHATLAVVSRKVGGWPTRSPLAHNDSSQPQPVTCSPDRVRSTAPRVTMTSQKRFVKVGCLTSCAAAAIPHRPWPRYQMGTLPSSVAWGLALAAARRCARQSTVGAGHCDQPAADVIVNCVSLCVGTSRPSPACRLPCGTCSQLRCPWTWQGWNGTEETVLLQKVPASAMAPAFKLSLPFDHVTRYMSHLINKVRARAWAAAVQGPSIARAEHNS